MEGDFTSMRFSFAFLGDFERYRDFSTTIRIGLPHYASVPRN
jgi:hypothetical protein